MTAGDSLPEDAVFRQEELLHDIAVASPQPFSSSKRGRSQCQSSHDQGLHQATWCSSLRMRRSHTRPAPRVLLLSLGFCFLPALPAPLLRLLFPPLPLAPFSFPPPLFYSKLFQCVDFMIRASKEKISEISESMRMRGLFPVLHNPTPRSPSKPWWKRDNAWSLGKEPWVGSSSIPLQRPTQANPQSSG